MPARASVTCLVTTSSVLPSSFSSKQAFLAPSLMEDPATNSLTEAREIKGGHSTFSTPCMLSSLSFISLTSWTACSMLVFIFQLPATMGRRISPLLGQQIRSSSEHYLRLEAQLLVREGIARKIPSHPPSSTSPSRKGRYRVLWVVPDPESGSRRPRL